MRCVLKVLPTVALSVGCGRDDVRVDEIVARDSAGVAVFTLQGEHRAPLLELNDRDGVRLGFPDPNIFLNGVVGGVRLASGSFAVGSRFTNQILFFDSLGIGVRTFGRAGGGPGEFASLLGVVALAGDAVAALDAAQRRISLISASAGLMRDYTIRPPDRAAPVGVAGIIGPTSNGHLLMWLQTMPSEEEIQRLNRPNSVGQIPVVVFAVDSTGHVPLTIGEFPGEDLYMGTLPGTQQLANLGRAPFGRWTRFGAYGGHAYVVRNEAQEIHVYSEDGSLRTIYRSAWPQRALTSEDRERTIDEWVRRSPRKAEWNARKKRFADMTLPGVMPAFRDAIIGTDGTLWIEPYQYWDGERRLFIAYDSSGVAIGKLAIGYKDRILEVGHGRLLRVLLNEDDTEVVHLDRYRF
jgi:hypothetical protein